MNMKKLDLYNGSINNALEELMTLPVSFDLCEQLNNLDDAFSAEFKKMEQAKKTFLQQRKVPFKEKAGNIIPEFIDDKTKQEFGLMWMEHLNDELVLKHKIFIYPISDVTFKPLLMKRLKQFIRFMKPKALGEKFEVKSKSKK